jgi:hypothetical protein
MPSNPGLGKQFSFHGRFHSKILASRRELEIPGSFIVVRKGYFYVIKPVKKKNPHVGSGRGTGKKQTFRKDLARIGGQWYIVDYTGFTSHPIDVVEGPFVSLAEARARFSILKSRDRYTRSPRYHATIPALKGLKVLRKYPTGQKPHVRKNPGKGTLIYGHVLKIFAQKTSGPYKGQRFVHTFKRGARMYGLPDGSLRIVHD